MPITFETYYKKGHIFLESPQGRNSLFDFFRREIEEGIENKDKLANAVVRLRTLKSYLKGDSFAFIDNDIPNAFRLRKKEDIKQDSLRFLKEIIGLVEKLYLKVNDAGQKFDILYILVKFMHEIPDLKMKHYTDLYLLLFHTVQFLDTWEGKENDVFDLGDLAIRSFGRYDCIKTGEYFLHDIKLKGLLDEFRLKYAPYEDYVARLKDSLKKTLVAGDFVAEDFTPLVFTDKISFILNELDEGLVFDLLLKNTGGIFSHINGRCFSCSVMMKEN